MSGAPVTHGAPLAARRGGFSLRCLAGGLSAVVLVLSAIALVAVAVAAASGLRIRIEQSGSMAPALNTGDLVIVKQIPAGSARVGDVIGVRSPYGQVIVHRVTALQPHPSGIAIATRGDANPTGERWVVPRNSEVALVKGSVPHAGAAIDAVQGSLAAAAVLLAGLLLAFGQLRSIWSRT